MKLATAHAASGAGLRKVKSSGATSDVSGLPEAWRSKAPPLVGGEGLGITFPSKTAAEREEEGRKHGGEQVGETQRWRWSGEAVGGGANEGETVKEGTGVRLEGEPIVLLTWPVQLPPQRLISPEVSSGNYHIVSRTRGYACRPHTHTHVTLQAYTHLQARCYGYMQYFTTAQRQKKTRQTIETEIDKRGEEITRADTKGEKENKSFTKGGRSRSGV